VKSLLLNLGKALEDDQHIQEIRKRFFDFVRPNSGQEHSDISRDIQRFISEVIGEGSRVVRTLKACNHSIIAPAILQLKKNICPQLMFKDGGT
jgi:hypothetical protein